MFFFSRIRNLGPDYEKVNFLVMKGLFSRLCKLFQDSVSEQRPEDKSMGLTEKTDAVRPGNEVFLDYEEKAGQSAEPIELSLIAEAETDYESHNEAVGLGNEASLDHEAKAEQPAEPIDLTLIAEEETNDEPNNDDQRAEAVTETSTNALSESNEQITMVHEISILSNEKPTSNEQHAEAVTETSMTTLSESIEQTGIVHEKSTLSNDESDSNVQHAEAVTDTSATALLESNKQDRKESALSAAETSSGKQARPAPMDAYAGYEMERPRKRKKRTPKEKKKKKAVPSTFDGVIVRYTEQTLPRDLRK